MCFESDANVHAIQSPHNKIGIDLTNHVTESSVTQHVKDGPHSIGAEHLGTDASATLVLVQNPRMLGEKRMRARPGEAVRSEHQIP